MEEGRAITAPANHRADFLLRDPDRIKRHDNATADKLHVPDAIQSIYRIANGAVRRIGVCVVNIELRLLQRRLVLLV